MAAIDIASGAHKFGSPALLAPSVSGTGYDAAGGTVSLNDRTYMQRPALSLLNGVVFAAFASCGPDPSPYHGWVVGISAASVQSTVAVFNVTPDGARGWQGGRGLAQDSQGFLYAMVGNGDYDGVRNFGNTILKLSSTGGVSDWFLPENWQDLDIYDLDLSTGGPMYLASMNLIVGGGKQGVVYALNANALGKSGAPVQSFQATTACVPLEFSGCYKIFGSALWDTTPGGTRHQARCCMSGERTTICAHSG